jgi:hypothetical protein
MHRTAAFFRARAPRSCPNRVSSKGQSYRAHGPLSPLVTTSDVLCQRHRCLRPPSLRSFRAAIPTCADIFASIATRYSSRDTRNLLESREGGLVSTSSKIAHVLETVKGLRSGRRLRPRILNLECLIEREASQPSCALRLVPWSSRSRSEATDECRLKGACGTGRTGGVTALQLLPRWPSEHLQDLSHKGGLPPPRVRPSNLRPAKGSARLCVHNGAAPRILAVPPARCRKSLSVASLDADSSRLGTDRKIAHALQHSDRLG